MPDEIAELRERINDYRRRSKSLYKPIAAAYADAADELEAKLKGEVVACTAVNPKSADG